MVALRGAVDQEPGPLRAPGLGGEQLRLLERRRFGADVDPLGDRGDVVAQPGLADQLAHRRVGAERRPCGRAPGSGRDRARRRRAGRRRRESSPDRRSGIEPSLRPPAWTIGAIYSAEHCWRIGDEAHPTRLLAGGGGRGRAGAAAERRASRPTWSWSAAASPGSGPPGTLKQLEPEARVVLLEAERLRARAERPQRRLLQRDVVLAAEHARALGGRGGAGGRPRRRARRSAGSASSASSEEVDAWFRPRRLPAGLDRRRPRRGLGRGARGLPRAGRRRCGAAARAPREVAARCASPAFRAGAFYPTSATRAAGAAGARPARAPARARASRSSSPRRCARCATAAGGVEARTAGGTVRARAAVLAIGGAAKGRRGPLRGRLTVASSHIVLTEPVPDAAGGDRLDRRRVHHRQPRPARLLPHHPGRPHRLRLGRRPDRDGRPAARPRPSSTPRSSPLAAEHLRAYFPGLAGRAHHPRLGRPDRRLADPPPRWSCRSRGGRAFAAAGYTGNGVGPSHMVGRTLASLALDRRDEHSRLAFVDPSPPRVPPEPFHWIGGEAIRLGILAKEEAEMAGRQPGPARLSRGQGPRADRLPHRPLRAIPVGVPLNFFEDRGGRPRFAARKKYKTFHPYRDGPQRRGWLRAGEQTAPSSADTG